MNQSKNEIATNKKLKKEKKQRRKRREEQIDQFFAEVDSGNLRQYVEEESFAVYLGKKFDLSVEILINRLIRRSCSQQGSLVAKWTPTRW